MSSMVSTSSNPARAYGSNSRDVASPLRERKLTQHSENYHAWKDDTGFAYDIMLTKVNTLTNSNERINLTIFESNASPRTYATNLHFAGTGKCPMNNILATLGSSLNTAMRFFRQAFHEKTGCNWDDRLKAYNERVSALKGNTRAAEDAVPFGERFFEYMPPRNASRGLLPDGRNEVPEVVRQMKAQIDLTVDETSDLDALLTGERELSDRLGVPILAEMNGETIESMSDVFDPTTLPADEHQFDFSTYETQANQTQLAAGVGEELLKFGDDDQDVDTTPTSKRKRVDQGDDGDEESPVAKKAATEHE
jgi:hypothetical protein